MSKKKKSVALNDIPTVGVYDDFYRTQSGVVIDCQPGLMIAWFPDRRLSGGDDMEFMCAVTPRGELINVLCTPIVDSLLKFELDWRGDIFDEYKKIVPGSLVSDLLNDYEIANYKRGIYDDAIIGLLTKYNADVDKFKQERYKVVKYELTRKYMGFRDVVNG